MTDEKLAEILYTVKRSTSPDPTAIPSWGNAPAEERETWFAVAARARSEVREMVHAELSAWAAERHTEASAAVWAAEYRADNPGDAQRAERYVWERVIRKLGGAP